MEEEKEFHPIAKVKVIGVGGGGSNSVESMLDAGIVGVEFLLINTDNQALEKAKTPSKIAIGLKKTTKGLGAGANPEIGEKAALEHEDKIREFIGDADMVILSAGMGGGTGTGASPVIAKIAKECGALVVALLTTPFEFEGPKRAKNAQLGIDNLKDIVDSYIIISNRKLRKVYGDVSVKDSFHFANTILKQTVRTITDIIALPGLINLDFADVKTIIQNTGEGIVGIGRASGKDRIIKAATNAISSPILASSIEGAKQAIVNISGNKLTLSEISKVTEMLRQATNNPDINNIMGIYDNDCLGDDVYVSIIATEINSQQNVTKTSEKYAEENNKNAQRMIETTEIKFEDDKTKEILLSNLKNGEVSIENSFSLNENGSQKESQDPKIPSFLRN